MRYLQKLDLHFTSEMEKTNDCVSIEKLENYKLMAIEIFWLVE